jgi:hypothetical protein
MRSCFDVELDAVGNVVAEFLTVTLNGKLYQDNRKKRRQKEKETSRKSTSQLYFHRIWNDFLLASITGNELLS